MNGRRRIGLFLMLGAAACSNPPASGSSATDPALARLVLNELPSDVQRRTLIDFEGRLALIGYDLEPVGLVAPGSPLTVRLYWQRTGTLGPGWGLFTHVVDAYGRRKVQVDRTGPLRTALPLSEWQLGKIYVDEQRLDIPNDIVSEATIVAGAWHAGHAVRPGSNRRSADLRLQVISGPDDGHNGGIVAHVATGKKPTPRLLRRRKS